MTNALFHFRQSKGITQDALAEAVGATKGMVSKWERGEAMPRRQYLEAIYQFTDGAVTANDFMGSFSGSETAA
jgi:transcriptional regulator with XRE-family HTH domain